MRRALMVLGVVIVVLAGGAAAVAVSPQVRDLGSQVYDNTVGRLFSHPDTDAAGDPQPVPGADLRGSGPGSLVAAVTMPAFARTSYGSEMRSARVLYRSTNGDTDAPTVVSGAVFVPPGDPPAGGWPVVALGHGTTGLDEPCAPSLSPSLLGMAGPVNRLVKAHFAVSLADYQGLGAPGVHPYTDARTAGRNVIDSVRALRRTFTGISNRWGAIGGSQGGGAVWSADEQAAGYAPELDLVGAVALAPAADVSGLVDKAQSGTLTADQRPALQLIIESLARLHPDLDRDDYRHGSAASDWDVLSACSGEAVHKREAATKRLQPGDLAPATPQAAARLRQLLQQWALPQQRLSAPLSIVYGGKDTYIDAPWTTAAIARACALGGTVDWQFLPDKGHGDIDIGDQLQWLADRFQGKPVASDCA